MVVGIGIALSLHSNVNKIVFDAASITDNEAKEGNLKR